MSDAAFDADILAVADELIPFFGRAMTLRRNSRTLADPAKPWGAVSTSAADIQSIAATGVFLNTKSSAFDAATAGTGQGTSSVEMKTGKVLVEALAALPEVMGRDWKVDDGQITYEVLASWPLKPGDTLFMYILEVKL